MKFGKRLLKEVDEIRRAESAADSSGVSNVTGAGHNGLTKSKFYVDYRELKKKIKMIALEYVSEATSAYGNVP